MPRMAVTTINIQISISPTVKRIAVIRVTIAIEASAIMMRSLRFILSARTPAIGEKMSNGKKDAMIEMVRITPDWVSKLMYQKIAYWTNNDPTKEIICPTIKNVILRCQCFMIFTQRIITQLFLSQRPILF